MPQNYPTDPDRFHAKISPAGKPIERPTAKDQNHLSPADLLATKDIDTYRSQGSPS